MTVTADRPVDTPPMTGCPTHRHAGAGADRRGDASPPALADGVQLLGEYAGTGYKTPQYLARLPGGQLVQLSHLLHLVAEQCDGSTSLEQIAERVTAAYGKRVSRSNVVTLVSKLRPLGVLTRADGSSPTVDSTDPLLGLKLRAQVLPPRLVQRLAAVVRPMFWPPLVVAVVLGLAAVDGWLFFVHGVGPGIRSTVEQPVVFLLVAAVVVLSAALHEFGHAAACSYGGARPGGMGAGIYVVWPAFYTDVTDAYRLDRRGRLRTDLGGVYVNAGIVLAAAGAYHLTGYEPLILIAFLLQIQVLQQMLPFLRLDGYYVVSDLVGVPDLFRRIGPVLRSAIPGRAREPEVEQLKPWVRRVIAGWVFVIVPVLALNLSYFVLSAPRIAATSWDAAMRFVGQIPAGGVDGTFAAVQLVLLLLPTVGITYTVLRFARRAASGAWSWSSGSLRRRLVVLTGASVLLAILTVAWYPDARMTPYREGERDPLQQHVRELRHLGSGEPLLRTPTTAQEPLPALPPGTSAVELALTPRAPAGASAPQQPAGTTGTAPRPPSVPQAPRSVPAPQSVPVPKSVPVPESVPVPKPAPPVSVPDAPAPAVPDAPAPALPDAPAPDAPAVPDAPEAPAPEAPAVPDAPAPDVPDVPAPDAPAPEAPAVPDAAPEAPDAPAPAPESAPDPEVPTDTDVGGDLGAIDR